MRHTHIRARRTLRSPSAGFTLIELMVVVAVIAILAAIAYGSYRHHVVKARRAAAATCLLEQAQRLERFHTLHLSYLDPAGNASGIAQCGDGLAQHYRVSLAEITTRAFRLQAEPLGAQAEADARCGTLAVNQLGIRTVSGTAEPDECW